MINYTEDKLISEGYTIENVEIVSADLSMADHGLLTLRLGLKGNCWSVTYGGYALGRGYLDAADNVFTDFSGSIEYLMRIMDVVGSSSFNGMVGNYVRIATKQRSDIVKIIGNIIRDKWFDAESFFVEKREENE